MFTIDGIVSGFDTTAIIEGLLGFQQNQINKFNARKAEITTKQSAFKGIEAQLLTLRGSLGRLNRIQSSVFDVQNATSSSEDNILAAASSGASNGVYNLTVESLAAAHQIGSQGFASSSSPIATGDISFQVGDRAASTITISESNNTLTGFVNAINEQVDDVTAGIVFDQGSDSYRILLTSKFTGESNEIVITSDLDPRTGPVPDFSGDPVQAAADAVVVLGSGPGAIRAQYSSNQVEDLIENVTLNLKIADPNKTVTISISQDTSAAQDAIETFVDDFNAIMEFIDNQTRFVPETNQASPLLGNRSVNDIQNRLRQFVIDTVPGLDGANRLASIGIDINTQGRLTVDSAQLGKALNGELEGVNPDEIRNLFGLNGTSNNAGIQFLTGGPRTLDSTTPYEVDITQAAEQATIKANSALNATTKITAANNEFQITVDGIVSETLTLEEGTYTPEELAALFETAINNSSELGAHNVEVSLNASGVILVTTESYGSAAKLSSVSGSAAGALGFLGTESGTGKDVAGSFVVNGVAESATGSGRVLVGDSDNDNTADLQVRVTLTPEQIVSGSEGEISVTRGVSGRLDQYLNDILDSETGTLKTINDEFETRISSIDESIKRVQEITETKRAYLIAEFTALESIINELQTTGNFLQTQFASLASTSRR